MSQRTNILVGLSAFVLLAVPTTAGGHARSAYSQLWHPDDYRIDYHFTTTFPGGTYKSQIKNGARQWSKLLRGPFFLGNEVTRIPESVVTRRNCGVEVNNQRVMVIRWAPLDGQYQDRTHGEMLGFHYGCKYESGPKQGYRYPGTITFDAAEQWYARTGDAPAGAPDLWSVATHEFGHAMGAKHYSRTREYCDNNSAQETMCPIHRLGTERMRTLGRHDIHTFKRVYPPAG